MGHKTLSSGVPVGTWGDKYDSVNPIKQKLINSFLKTLISFIGLFKSKINSINEIGCGEGHVTRIIHESFSDLHISASDYSKEVIDIARKQTTSTKINYAVKNIYKLRAEIDSADMIVCSEVLEHLEQPREALEVISKLSAKYFLFSVPNEPLWRILQLISGNNIFSFGNTPGHINHWSSGAFRRLVSEKFNVIKFKTVLPWTIILATKK